MEPDHYIGTLRVQWVQGSGGAEGPVQEVQAVHGVQATQGGQAVRFGRFGAFRRLLHRHGKGASPRAESGGAEVQEVKFSGVQESGGEGKVHALRRLIPPSPDGAVWTAAAAITDGPVFRAINKAVARPGDGGRCHGLALGRHRHRRDPRSEGVRSSRLGEWREATKKR